jgi:hypothetical protein
MDIEFSALKARYTTYFSLHETGQSDRIVRELA